MLSISFTLLSLQQFIHYSTVYVSSNTYTLPVACSEMDLSQCSRLLRAVLNLCGIHRVHLCRGRPMPTQVQLSDSPPSSHPSPPPLHDAKSKQHWSLPAQPPPVLPHPQKSISNNEDAYAEIGLEGTSTQQEKVQIDWKVPSHTPQASTPSPPLVPAYSDHFPKPQPKEVPSMAIPLIPPVSTQLHPPPVTKKPIMLSE